MSLLSRITQFWRNIGTGISFACFGIFGLSLSLGIIPLCCLLCPRKSRARVAQRCVCASFKIFTRLMRGLHALDYRIENADRLVDDRHCLIVANHPSLIDYVFLTSLMPHCDCIVKEALWDNFFIRGVIRSADYIPNRDADEVLDACRRKLQAGGRILIFPEGTRSTPGQPLHLHRGAANIAVRCQADIRLVHITCAPPILTKQQKWWQTADTRPQFLIRIGEKIAVRDFLLPGLSAGHAARLLNKRLTAELSAPLSLTDHESANQRHQTTHHRDPQPGGLAA